MTDPVADATTWWVGTPGPGTINDNLRTPINDLGHDTGFIALTAAGNWTAGSSFGVQRIGHMVMLYGAPQRANSILASGSGFDATIATLPAGQGLRPAAGQGNMILPGCCARAGVRIEWAINTDGTLQIRNVGTVDMQVGDFAVTPPVWMVP